jgi:multidrug efflux pump subunit AcrA (membrane-fusion protein)
VRRLALARALEFVRRLAVLLLLALTLAVASGCGKKAEKEGEGAGASKAEAAAPDAPTPVVAAAVSARDLAVVVSAPGKTAALNQQKVRAPFAGTLTALTVSDGDRVRRGQVVGTVVSRESEAALSGAREMLRDSHSPAERADAERAVALAEQNLVRKPLMASADGAVLSHAASAGEKVSEDQEVLTIEDASTVVFVADVPQTDLAKIRDGQRATVQLGSDPRAIPGTVHSILPGANAADFTGSVRVDLPAAAARLALGLFGMARIVVGERPGALVVPDAAVLKDDVTGVTRVASIAGGKIHWLDVKPGLRQDGVTEIAGAPLQPGAQVAVSGMIGLPEGKTVAVATK